MAEASYANVRRVMAQYMRWLAPTADPWSEINFEAWLRSKTLILPSTKLTYLKNFLQVRTWATASPLTRMRQELINNGAEIPTNQAEAAPASLLDSKRLQVPLHKRMQIWLAWKTASRWSDLTRLTTENFHIVDERTLIVDWANKTKSSIRRPFRASKYAVVQGSRTRELIAWVRTLRDPIDWMSTGDAALVLKSVDPRLSAHSIKVGATQVLERAVADKKLPMALKSRLLKHDPRDPSLEMSLRYGRDKVAQAFSLETQAATRLL